MADAVVYKVREGVALLTVDNPPVNALTRNVRAALLAGLDAALDDPAIGAIVIQAQGRTFPAGADLRDYTQHVEEPALGTLCDRIEAAPKPVVAAIHGTALGGGFELALACHFRLVHVAAQLGLPDVALGLVPAAGGSQRLARIVGAHTALEMMISGRPVSAEAAVRMGLADRAIQKNLGRAAFGTARNLAREATPPRRSRDRAEGLADPAAYLAEIAARREAAVDEPRHAVHRAIDLVEAALLLPFEAGLAMERAFFEDLVDSDQSHGLRHAFLAERRTTRVPQLAERSPRPVGRVGVIGAGRLGAGIVRGCLAAGLPVTLVEADAAALEAAQKRIASGLARDLERGRLTAARRDAQLSALTPATDMAALAEADLVIEAGPEDPATRRAVFAAAGAATRPGTVLASAGLSPDLVDLAAAAGRPDEVMGLRFFAPAHRVRLVEVICPTEAAPDLAATAVALAQALGKVPVLPGSGGASVALPVFGALVSSAAGSLVAGASVAQVDAALRDYGFTFGPFQLADRAGIDRLAGLAWPGQGGRLMRAMARAGLIGQRAGRGFYTYGASGDEPTASPEVPALVDSLRDPGDEPRRVPAEEICERAALAMANCGARLVAAGVAQRPSDIDAAMLAGFGFPRWRGGPMEVADRTGLLPVRNRLRSLAIEGDAALHAPAPLFDVLIKNGYSFERLNGRVRAARRDG